MMQSVYVMTKQKPANMILGNPAQLHIVNQWVHRGLKAGLVEGKGV